MNNIFLIGMMGSWKSTIGRKLAKTLDIKFIDTDDEIEEIMGMKISEIFMEFGEIRFREMESAFFIEAAKQSKRLFSTGGGIILNEDNRRILRENGTTIFLNAKPGTLANRIHNTTKRPLLLNSNNLVKRFKKIWNDRSQYYEEVADHKIDTDDKNPDEVLKQIVKILEA